MTGVKYLCCCKWQEGALIWNRLASEVCDTIDEGKKCRMLCKAKSSCAFDFQLAFDVIFEPRKT